MLVDKANKPAMLRFAVLALCSAACGRSQSVPDQELTGLVVEAKKPDAAIDVERATREPAELTRALMQPYRATLAALGPHSVAVNTETVITERAGAAGGSASAPVTELSDHAQIENGDAGAFHGIYTNSADYGREVTFVDGKLYLRPRYQRWHGRAPEAPDEPAALRDQFFDALGAMWDLLAPGAELSDGGPIEIAGRAGRKISVRRSAEPANPPAEPLAQRRWREARTVDAVTGEIVLDAAKGVPLAVKLAGTIGFSRDGRRFTMKVSLDSALSGLGTTTEIAAPGDDDVVATPERLREVDARDYLLQGIAPPLRRNADGTAVPPAPAVVPATQPSPSPPSGGSSTKPATRSGDATHRRERSTEEAAP